MKSALFGFILSAALLYSQAQEDGKPKEGEIKIYKRLIPADVLRGECARLIDRISKFTSDMRRTSWTEEIRFDRVGQFISAVLLDICV